MKTTSKHGYYEQQCLIEFRNFSNQMNCKQTRTYNETNATQMKLKRSKQSFGNTIVQSIYFKVHFCFLRFFIHSFTLFDSR